MTRLKKLGCAICFQYILPTQFQFSLASFQEAQRRWYAHRTCLLASSDAFRAMFDGGMIFQFPLCSIFFLVFVVYALQK
ncbi:ARM repeat protein interacting with ABF2 [Pyrus ussuriensis x Pyrus communis]|uniref:ARM repeat protein interacting with ABF2 n=1 Tax=Pyrus ussuriensis x Pyrus communis TaxID=2448454 RepID=A0A5N5I164_9ROSA|nr:ARM repeat protein interacting with ABF2 [Pyrus ussuriensis x Pyrus communis]